MKKRTAIGLMVAFGLVVVGGIGSVATFNSARTTAYHIDEEEQPLKNAANLEVLHLQIDGDAPVVIDFDESDKIAVSSQSTFPTKIDSSLDVSTKENEATAKVVTTTTNEKLHFGVQMRFFYIHSTVHISVPKSVKQLYLTGSATDQVLVANARLELLDSQLPQARVALSDNVITKLAITSQQEGQITITDTKSEQIDLETNSGAVYFGEVTADQLSIKTQTGDIYLNDSRGTFILDNQHGNTALSNVRGSVTATGKNSSFTMDGEYYPDKLNVTLDNGDIVIYPGNILYDVKIETTTAHGSPVIFGKKRETYQEGQAQTNWVLQSNLGNITIDGPSEYYEEDGN